MTNIVTEFRQRLAADAAQLAINRGTPNPPKRPAPGSGALEWCRQHIPNFASHERQVLASDAHRAEMLAKVRK